MDKTELISQPELLEWTGFKRKSKLVEWLLSNKIPFFYVYRGDVATTISAINNPLVGQKANNEGEDEEISF